MDDRQCELPFDAPGPAPDSSTAPPAVRVPDSLNAVPPTLDETMIGVVVLREVDRALGLYPNWAHPFAGLALSRARRSYGQANRDGHILISRVFLGTDALDDLEDTVRHELAHLIAGIDERHGPSWRRVAKRLGATPRARGRAVSPQLASRMEDAPYTLVAVLESGEEREVKTVFRRSRTYLQYRYRWGGRHYEVEGQKVLRFRYDEN